MQQITQSPALAINRRRLMVSSAAVAATGIVTLKPGIVYARGARSGSKSFSITNADVNGAKPFVISQPGLYTLAEDIDWTTRDPNAKGIDIQSDYVTLDLAGHTFQQVNLPAPQRDPQRSKYKGEIVSRNVGIWSDGHKGLVIRNGSVANIQGVGILLKDCDHLDCIGLAARGCGGNGTLDTSFLYRNGGLFVIGTKSASGIRFAKDVRIVDCTCEQNTSSLDYVVTLGAFVLFTDDLEVKNGRFHQNANSSPQPSGVQFNVVGIDIVICRNVLVEDCEANDNTSGGEPAGFFAWGENIKFLRARANRNFTLKGNRVCGFNVSTTNNLQMIDCEADETTTPIPTPRPMRSRTSRRAASASDAPCSAAAWWTAAPQETTASGGMQRQAASLCIRRVTSSSDHARRSAIAMPAVRAAGSLPASMPRSRSRMRKVRASVAAT